MEKAKDIRQEVVKEVQCPCDVSVRANCPVCMGTGKRKVYFCVECGIRLPPGLDGNLCDKCLKEPDAYPAEKMHSEDGGVLAELTEKGESKSRPEMLKDGVMKYIEANAPWSDMTHEKLDKSLDELGLDDKKLDEFLEAAFGPSDLEIYWKRGGWILDREKGEFTKGELHISIETAMEIRRMCQYLEPMLYVGSVRSVIAPDDKIVPGMVVETEPIEVREVNLVKYLKAERERRDAVRLLKRWYGLNDETGTECESFLDRDTGAFLKELEDVDPS